MLDSTAYPGSPSPTAAIADVVIVGGGFTGASLACALADGQRAVTLIEARPGPRRSFAGELIHPTGAAVLESLGLREALEHAGAVAIQGFAVFRGPLSVPALLPYEGAPGVRTSGMAIDHDRMVAALRSEAARRPGVTVRFGDRVVDLVRDAGGRVSGVRLESGEVVRARLVLGAEGRHAKLRAVLGIPVESKLLSYTAAVRIAGAHLPRPGHGHIFLGAPGPILAYPIGGGEARACFDLAEAVRPDELSALLRERYLPHVPATFRADLERALGAETPQLVATHAMRAAGTVKDGMALVGDAGGCAHPLTAGGMTLCLNDIQILRDVLARGPLDEALERYQHDRLPMALVRITLTDALYEIFSRDEPGMAALREAIFRYWQSERGRQASMSLLAGAEVRPSRLALEYGRVALHALALPERGDAIKAAVGQARKTWRAFFPAS